MAELVFATRRFLSNHAALVSAVATSVLLLAVALHTTDALEALLAARLGSLDPVGAALLATLCTALATGVGALPLLATRNVSTTAQTTMLGFTAGMMLAASFFSLLSPALDHGAQAMGSTIGGGLFAAAAVLLGASFLMLMERWVPHEHDVQGAHGRMYPALRRVWLFAFAVTLHNVPEGLAVGVAFATGDHSNGLPLALGLAVQNAPEGLAVALAMLTLHYTRAQAILIALASGMVEPVGGLVGAGAIAAAPMLLPWGLGFAAGAMLFVISHEIIPESHRNRRETSATIGLIAGFILMMLFDTALA